MKLTRGILVLSMLVCAPFLAGEQEEVIPLDQVPENVLKAATEAVPGIVFARAEREVERGVTVYELAGTADGKGYEVEVTEAGEVLEIEEAEVEDDEDDDEEDEDDEPEDDEDER